MWQYLRDLIERIDYRAFTNHSRFGLGLDLWFDDDSYQLDLGLGRWTLSLIITK